MATLENPIRITELPETVKTVQNITEEDVSGISFPQEVKKDGLPGDIRVVDFMKVDSAGERATRDNGTADSIENDQAANQSPTEPSNLGSNSSSIILVSIETTPASTDETLDPTDKVYLSGSTLLNLSSDLAKKEKVLDDNASGTEDVKVSEDAIQPILDEKPTPDEDEAVDDVGNETITPETIPDLADKDEAQTVERVASPDPEGEPSEVKPPTKEGRKVSFQDEVVEVQPASENGEDDATPSDNESLSPKADMPPLLETIPVADDKSTPEDEGPKQDAEKDESAKVGLDDSKKEEDKPLAESESEGKTADVETPVKPDDSESKSEPDPNADEYIEQTSYTFTWTVKDLKKKFTSSTGDTKSAEYESQKFGDGKWVVLFYPSSGTDYISVYLGCEPTEAEKAGLPAGHWKRKELYDFSLELWHVGKTKMIERLEAKAHEFNHDTPDWGWFELTHRDSYFNDPAIVAADALVICCNATTSLPEDIGKTEQNKEDEGDGEKKGPGKQQPAPASNDLTGEVEKRGQYPAALGGYADVYEATWKKPGGEVNVAIKVLRMRIVSPEEDTKIRKQLARELHTWQLAKHRHVLPFFGTCTDFGPYPSMVSPWMKNGNAVQYLKTLGDGADWKVRSKLVLETAEGLAFLHSMSIIHGDLKGSNILIHDDGSACLCDFGLSRVLEESAVTHTITFTTAAAGTLRWTAPELLGFDASTRKSVQTDVYAFGCVALELLTGFSPFHHVHSEPQVIMEISKGARPHAERPAAEIVRETEWVLMQSCWETDPGMRPSMRDVVERVRGIRKKECDEEEKEEEKKEVGEEIGGKDEKEEEKGQGKEESDGGGSDEDKSGEDVNITGEKAIKDQEDLQEKSKDSRDPSSEPSSDDLEALRDTQKTPKPGLQQVAGLESEGGDEEGTPKIGETLDSERTTLESDTGPNEEGGAEESKLSESILTIKPIEDDDKEKGHDGDGTGQLKMSESVLTIKPTKEMDATDTISDAQTPLDDEDHRNSKLDSENEDDVSPTLSSPVARVEYRSRKRSLLQRQLRMEGEGEPESSDNDVDDLTSTAGAEDTQVPGEGHPPELEDTNQIRSSTPAAGERVLVFLKELEEGKDESGNGAWKDSNDGTKPAVREEEGPSREKLGRAGDGVDVKEAAKESTSPSALS